MKKHGRSRTKDADKIRSLTQGDIQGFRSRSRGRSRSNYNFRNDSKDGFRERCGNEDDEKKRKEQDE